MSRKRYTPEQVIGNLRERSKWAADRWWVRGQLIRFERDMTGQC